MSQTRRAKKNKSQRRAAAAERADRLVSERRMEIADVESKFVEQSAKYDAARSVTGRAMEVLEVAAIVHRDSGCESTHTRLEEARTCFVAAQAQAGELWRENLRLKRDLIAMRGSCKVF